jgi:NitT/TauT family transport system ATP-binding protein
MMAPSDTRSRVAAVRVEGVSKTFHSRQGDVHALASTDLSVEPGEIICIVGPSGCGKSTLLRLISGLDLRYEGVVEVDGCPVTRPVTEVGFVFQQPVLLDWLSVIDNILLQVECRPGDKQAARRYAESLLDMVGLENFKHGRVYELSGGMQQRVALCRGLVHKPPLLLMDEPFGALDALTRDQITIDIQPLLQQVGASVLMVTHSIAEAVFLADRVIVMSKRPGTIIESVPVDLPRPRTLEMRKWSTYVDAVAHVTDTFENIGVLS